MWAKSEFGGVLAILWGPRGSFINTLLKDDLGETLDPIQR